MSVISLYVQRASPAYGHGELSLVFWDDQNAANNKDLNQVCNSNAAANEFELFVDGCFLGRSYECRPDTRRVAIDVHDSTAADCSGAGKFRAVPCRAEVSCMTIS